MLDRIRRPHATCNQQMHSMLCSSVCTHFLWISHLTWVLTDVTVEWRLLSEVCGCKGFLIRFLYKVTFGFLFVTLAYVLLLKVSSRLCSEFGHLWHKWYKWICNFTMQRMRCMRMNFITLQWAWAAWRCSRSHTISTVWHAYFSLWGWTSW